MKFWPRRKRKEDDLNVTVGEWAEGMTPEEWDRQYDEAMQWRDWGTCDYLLSLRRAGRVGKP